MNRLYVRIWLAVVGAVVLLTLALSLAGRWYYEDRLAEQMAQQPGGAQAVPWLAQREVSLRDAQGKLVAQATGPAVRVPGRNIELPMQAASQAPGQETGQPLVLHFSPPKPNRAGGPPPKPMLPPPERSAWGYALVVLAVALAVAAGAYPVTRRLTGQLERLKASVQQWGRGDLAHRADVKGSDEVAYLAEQFNQSAAQIEQLVRAQRSLLANASHELRSPLARIRMGLELLESNVEPATQERLQLEVKRSMGELDALIDEVLLASRMDAPGMEAFSPQPVDLVALLAEECAQTGAELAVSAAPELLMVQGEPKLLRRLVRNLLENGERYASGSVEAVLTLRHNKPLLQVQDGGPGIPPEQRERIFEPFYRTPGASERAGGVGLGLSLVRSIANRHGAEVSTTDRADGHRGACFEVAFLNAAAESKTLQKS